MEVYVVKSFGPENGWVNLAVFDNNDAAVAYARKTEKQIDPKALRDETELVEIEHFLVRSW